MLKKLKKDKEEYIPMVGITGVGKDYNVYDMPQTEKLLAMLIGFIGGFTVAHIMFKVFIVSVVFGAVIAVAAVPVYRDIRIKQRRETLLMRFRDVLDSLSNSLSAGRNTPDAFSDAYNDMVLAYGDDTDMVEELAIIVNGLHNNYLIEDLLKDMAKRSGLGDVDSFAETFVVCNRLGGNLKKIVSESRDIISDKIEIEMEIQTSITSQKNEINIMCFIPLAVVMMMGTMGNEGLTANTPLNVIVKLIAIGLFVFAYRMARDITDIKV